MGTFSGTPLVLMCYLDNQVVMEGCFSLTVAASNPEMVDMLPHVRGQGVMDLEFESDGGCAVLVCLTHSSFSCPTLSLHPILPFCSLTIIPFLPPSPPSLSV